MQKSEERVESDVDSSDESGDDSDIDDRSISQGKQQQIKVDPKTKITKKDGFETVPQGLLFVKKDGFEPVPQGLLFVKKVTCNSRFVIC